MTVAAPRVTYLNHEHTVASWLLTKDHKRIGIMYLAGRHLCVLPRRPLRVDDSPRAGDAGRRPRVGGHLQQDVHHARRGHGVLRADPCRARHSRQLRPAADARRQGRRVPEAESPELVHLRHRIPVYALRDGHRWRRHRMDLLSRRTAAAHRIRTSCDRTRRVHHRVLVDPDRPELHGDDPPDARARAHLVPAAAVRVGALLDQPGADPRHTGHRDHGARISRSSASCTSASSTRCLVAIRCSSSTCSGSTRTRRSTS